MRFWQLRPIKHPENTLVGSQISPLSIAEESSHTLRKILVRGARSAVLRVKRERAPFGAWLDALELA